MEFEALLLLEHKNDVTTTVKLLHRATSGKRQAAHAAGGGLHHVTPLLELLYALQISKLRGKGGATEWIVLTSVNDKINQSLDAQLFKYCLTLYIQVDGS